MKNQEITTLIGQKRAYNSSSFLLRSDLIKNPESIDTKKHKSSSKAKNIAILASKKNFKTAVVRNSVRRLIKNAINKVYLEIAADRKVDIKVIKSQVGRYNLIFSPKKGFEMVVFEDLVEEIKQSFIKNGII